jgi:hypothetical protein
MTLKERDFSYWSVEEAKWKVDGGSYDLFVGSSSRDIKFNFTA